MKKSNTLIQISSPEETTVHRYDHQETARLARVATRTLLKYWRHGLIQPIYRGERYGIFFDEQAIYRVRKAESIRSAMNTNIVSAAIIMKLMEEVDDLRSELRFSRKV